MMNRTFKLAVLYSAAATMALVSCNKENVKDKLLPNVNSSNSIEIQNYEDEASLSKAFRNFLVSL